MTYLGVNQIYDLYLLIQQIRSFHPWFISPI